jgi:anti-sigma regulatory factor (Ser/Thr protein kinase)
VIFRAIRKDETTMEFDLPGRIKHTHLLQSDALLPVFEAVVNSIHAISELNSGVEGEIRVHIIRDQSQERLTFDQGTKPVLQPIRSFLIVDNGVGFNDIHFRSFSTADSQQKAALGGKGIGRFLWLKAFDRAEIESTFRGLDGANRRRQFSLKLTPKGIEDHAEGAADGEKRTSVRLCDVKPEYEKGLPHSAETIARKIVEHCLEHFVLGSAPEIFVHDSDSPEVHSLYELFEEQIKVTSTVSSFQVGGRHFNLHNLRVSPSYQNTHKLHFCANNRSVTTENLTGRIPNLVGSLKDEQSRPFMYAGYVSGQYLNDAVNSERTDFVVPDEDSVAGPPGWNSILDQTIKTALAFVESYTSSVKAAKEKQITEFVNFKAPQYRPLVKHRKDLLDRIAPELPEEKLDVELYKANQVYEADLREESTKILDLLEHRPSDWQQFQERYASFLEEWNESGIAKLARHIVHRKATLDFLRASLKVAPDGKYQLERAIHQLIFPLKKTSDDIGPDQMNLWMLDEKLAYHSYLASDIRFNAQDVQLPSNQRPDIIIFNGPAAFVDQAPPFSSVVLIEFKRPLRDDYSGEDNPITQVYEYAELIKSGKALDRNGRPIIIKPDTPIYAYVLCDLTETLARQAMYASLSPTPDSLGYFGFNPNLRVMVEIISFDKLVGDAERRNAAHFDKLNLPLLR